MYCIECSKCKFYYNQDNKSVSINCESNYFLIETPYGTEHEYELNRGDTCPQFELKLEAGCGFICDDNELFMVIADGDKYNVIEMNGMYSPRLDDINIKYTIEEILEQYNITKMLSESQVYKEILKQKFKVKNL